VNLIQKSLNVFLQLRVAGQNQPATVERGDPDLHHLDGGQVLQNRRGGQSRRVNHQPVFQRDLQAVSQEGNQDMGFGGLLDLVIDGTNVQFAL